MERYLPSYGFPEELSGKSVLDVGTSTGYIAAELARRGGDVTAIDLGDGWVPELVFRGLNVDVRYLRMSIFDLQPIGQFDLVFSSSVLVHLWDQFTALQRLRSVCKGQLIVATPIMHSRWILRRTPVARFVGIRVGAGTDEEYWTTWKPNARALVEMVEAAGFDHAEFRGTFRLRSEPGHGSHDALHGVAHGFVRR
jgi:2-polyprenyl-3-methyl-5-hydroxy-6-metoxy-1,4-benzoquinol methylase